MIDKVNKELDLNLKYSDKFYIFFEEDKITVSLINSSTLFQDIDILVQVTKASQIRIPKRLFKRLWMLHIEKLYFYWNKENKSFVIKWDI
jgi:hypothetical protein